MAFLNAQCDPTQSVTTSGVADINKNAGCSPCAAPAGSNGNVTRCGIISIDVSAILSENPCGKEVKLVAANGATTALYAGDLSGAATCPAPLAEDIKPNDCITTLAASDGPLLFTVCGESSGASRISFDIVECDCENAGPEDLTEIIVASDDCSQTINTVLTCNQEVICDTDMVDVTCEDGPTTTQPCDDGDPCTVGEMETILDCDMSVCIPCSGGMPAGCAGPTTTRPCDDGDPCTVGEMETISDCDMSVCIPCGGGTPLDCNGSTTTRPCDDGDPCTVGEMETILDCDMSVCIPCGGGTPLGCAVVTFQPCNDGNPCTFNDQVGLNECGEICQPCMGVENCRPFMCDDGNPCTVNDRVLIGCDGVICEPCSGTMAGPNTDKDGDGVRDCEDECPHDPNKSVAGDCGCGEEDIDSDGDGVSDCNDECPDNPNTALAGACGCDAPGIVDVAIANASGCNDNGTSDPDDDYFIADIVVTFNFAPELGGIDITGPVEVYYNFENGNQSNVITIPDQIMPADGKPISIVAAYRGNEECNACVHVGSAPSACSTTPCVHPDYSAVDPSGTCITDITLSKISKCHDNGTGVYTADDFVYASVTVHLDGAPKGNLVLGGMASGIADIANHSGSSYTFSHVKLSYNQGGGNLKAYIVDHYDSDAVLCSYQEGGFECDPCTAANYGSRVAQTQLPIVNTDLNLSIANPNLNLTPNPAINEVLISNLAPDFNEGRIELKVFDATGQLHIAQVLTARDNIRLNVDALTNGVYLIQLSNQSTLQTARLMKVQ